MRRRTSKPRALAIPRQSEDTQPTAILGALGLIATLMLTWASLVL
jgi:hypothetical protein